MLRTATRALSRPTSTQTASRITLPVQRHVSSTTARSISSSPGRRDKNDPFHESSSATLGKPGYKHEGSQSRTDESIVVEYPGKGELEAEPTIQGRGGPHLKRTLPTFSLEGRVAVVTGGARGLGLVMAQSLAASGADVALVDLNGECFQYRSETLLTVTCRTRSSIISQSHGRAVQEGQSKCRVLRSS